MEIITSTANPKIKNIKRLDKASERKEQGLFIAEGLREVVLAARAGYEIESLFICEELLQPSADYPLQECHVAHFEYAISKSVYESVAYRDSTEGIIATIKIKQKSLTELQLPTPSLILVIEGVEKPGNLGAMLRTADAAGAHAVVVCDPRCDIYNPNVIRSSIGTVFTNTVVVCESTEAIAWLKQQKIKTFAAELSAKKFHYEQNYLQATAFAMGTESKGLSSEWMNAAEERIKIPMLGQIDSMNVSVSAGILLYEAVRQRKTEIPK